MTSQVKPTDYTSQFTEIVSFISETRNKGYRVANTALIDLYWRIGKYISDRVDNADWGEGVVGQLSRFIQSHVDNARGFSDKNLWRMKQFYQTYSNPDEKLSSLEREVSWANNLKIISQCKTREEREFYLEALDRDVRKPNENPSIGILLCKDKDDEVVEYALARTMSPAMVAEYKLQLPDKKILQAKMRELFKAEADTEYNG